MCRLLAYAAPRETTVSEVIGAQNAGAFQRMTTLHNDGWGTAWLAAGPGEATPELESLRVSTPGQHDPLLESAITADASTARLVHLRLATDSHKRTKVNTHPFLKEGFAFAHNGTIIPVEIFSELLRDESYDDIEGSTDSELYFAFIRQEVREAGGTVADGVVSALQQLRATFPIASLNAVVLTEQELIVVHANSTAYVNEATFRSYGVDPERLPLGHREHYYKLAMRQAADGTTVFSSTGIDLAGWSRVPDDTITRVDLETLELTQSKIFDSTQTAARLESTALNDATIHELAPRRRQRDPYNWAI